jgi:N-acetyl-D-muramate 6-phosphate phosphatase
MPLDRSRIQALCFDIDGTLRDTDDQWVESVAGYLRPLQRLLPQNNPHLLARWLVMKVEGPGNALQHLIDHMGLDQMVAPLARPLRKNRGKKRYPAVPGVSDMLARVQQHYPLAVISARGRQTTLAFLETQGFSPLFKIVVTGQTCRYTKPHPDPLLYAANAMGVPAANCLMVGDTRVDILTGKAAGAQTVGVLCGFGERDELLHAGADLILESTAELADHLLARDP